MSKYKGPQDRLDLYEKLVACIPDIKRKGAANPYTSHNGHMFSFLDKTGTLGIRLPKDEQEKFMEEYGTGPFIQYGKTMRGYVTIPDDLLEDTDMLLPYLEMSLKYIKTLEPK